MLWHVCYVQDSNTRNFFYLLNLGCFILLGQGLHSDSSTLTLRSKSEYVSPKAGNSLTEG